MPRRELKKAAKYINRHMYHLWCDIVDISCDDLYSDDMKEMLLKELRGKRDCVASIRLALEEEIEKD